MVGSERIFLIDYDLCSILVISNNTQKKIPSIIGQIMLKYKSILAIADLNALQHYAEFVCFLCRFERQRWMFCRRNSSHSYKM